jgi:hypothetical protein
MMQKIKTPRLLAEPSVSLAEAYFAAGHKDEAARIEATLIPTMNTYAECPSWQSPKPELFSRIAIPRSKPGRLDAAEKTARRISVLSIDLRNKTLEEICGDGSLPHNTMN